MAAALAHASTARATSGVNCGRIHHRAAGGVSGAYRQALDVTAFGARGFPASYRAWLAVLCIVAAVPVDAQPAGLTRAESQAAIEFGAGWGWGWPYDPAMWPYPLYPGYYWYTPCYPFVSCAEYLHQRSLDRRRRRMEDLGKPDERRLPPVGIETWGGLPANQRRRADAPRTRDDQVQPGYESFGQVRPEYRGSGDFLPEFLEGRVRRPD
jgi:hypothetical protein